MYTNSGDGEELQPNGSCAGKQVSDFVVDGGSITSPGMDQVHISPKLLQAQTLWRTGKTSDLYLI